MPLRGMARWTFSGRAFEQTVEDAVQRAVTETLRSGDEVGSTDYAMSFVNDQTATALAYVTLSRLVSERLAVVRARQARQRDTPETVLDRRLAAGEITCEQHEHKLAVLRGESRRPVEEIAEELAANEMRATGHVGVYVRGRADGSRVFVATWPNPEKPGAVKRHTLPAGASIEDAIAYRAQQLTQADVARDAA